MLKSVKLIHDNDQGYFDIRFFEILNLIHSNRKIDVYRTYENEGYSYQRKMTYDAIEELWKEYTGVSLRLFLARYYRESGIEDEVSCKKLTETIYHLLANHMDVFHACDEVLNIDEFRGLLTEEEIKTYLANNQNRCLPHLYEQILMNMSRDFGLLTSFISQQQKQDSSISLGEHQKLYTLGKTI